MLSTVIRDIDIGLLWLSYELFSAEKKEILKVYSPYKSVALEIANHFVERANISDRFKDIGPLAFFDIKREHIREYTKDKFISFGRELRELEEKYAKIENTHPRF